MQNFLTATLLINIRNTVEMLPVEYPQLQSECIMFTKENNYYIICNISEKKKLTDISVVLEEDFISFSPVYIGSKSQNFIHSINARSFYQEKLKFHFVFNFKMSTFLFENHCLTGIFHQLYRSKSFYYIDGKQQKENNL